MLADRCPYSLYLDTGWSYLLPEIVDVVGVSGSSSLILIKIHITAAKFEYKVWIILIQLFTNTNYFQMLFSKASMFLHKLCKFFVLPKA